MIQNSGTSAFARFSRRRILSLLSSAAGMVASGLALPGLASGSTGGALALDRDDWEGLNPGYWHFENGRVRRALQAVGDRARNTGFPYHYESGWEASGAISRSYDPSLPLGIIWNRRWKMTGDFETAVETEIIANSRTLREGDDKRWAMYQPNYAVLGIGFGAKTLFESFHPSDGASPLLLLRENGEFGFCRHVDASLPPVAPDALTTTRPVKPGEVYKLHLAVRAGQAVGTLYRDGAQAAQVRMPVAGKTAQGFVGLATRGAMDFAVTAMTIDTRPEQAQNAPQNACHVCYALGDTLKEGPDGWTVRFVGLFRSVGKAEIRIASAPNPQGGWAAVPVAGSADIISNDFREHTAIIDARLPASPADMTLYYTVWKDGVDVTADPRLGTDAVGVGTGLVGDMPLSGSYVGRLPRLAAPYRIAGLSCHAIHTASRHDLNDPDTSRTDVADRSTAYPMHEPFYVHDQPCHGAYRHMDAFDYQIALWEDDVWYMELLLYPPSTADAYRQVTLAIAGPTTRWQMMRHWNLLNPGDHDHGMDDVKGPEQLLLRNRAGLGQDSAYLARNFQIVDHLMRGEEAPSGTANPKRWRKWKMPNRDFSLIVTDARLWRSSQDTAIWDDQGWDHDRTLYSRRDPTRSLLGEAQFAWLSEELKTDSAPLICLTGMNALHTIWAGHDGRQYVGKMLERDRVSADYAGWVSAGADRVLDLISRRTGVMSLYGDVHAGSIVRNRALNIYECSFGPNGRWGGRGLVKGFGRTMTDEEGRPVEVIALYHHEFKNPDLEKQEGVNYWNLLEARFDPRPADPEIHLAIRNVTDAPDAPPRGGGSLAVRASQMGKTQRSILPAFTTLAEADLLIIEPDGSPVRGARSDSQGQVAPLHLPGVVAGTRLTIVASRGADTRSHSLVTQPPSGA